MSNLRSTGHLPLKTSMSSKWKSQAANSEMLERQTRALEESLNKLKSAIHPDKNKSNADPNAPIWDKGKAGPMTQYASHVLREEPRRTFDPNKPTKVRVLGDEPAVPVVRPSLVANLFSPKASAGPSKSVVKCGQCEKDEAKMKCLECAESYCAGCFAHFHLRGALQKHRCVPLTESRPNTPQRRKPTVGADVIYKELRFAQSKENLYRNSMAENDDEDFDDFDEPIGGDLLHGHYDEKSSAMSFQQALMQWRQGGTTNPKRKAPAKKKTKTHEAQMNTAYDENGMVNMIPMPKIQFNSSKLTYGEKLLVKKYRRDKKNESQTPTPRRNQMEIVPNSVLHQSLPVEKIDIEPLYEDLSTSPTQDSQRTITDDNQEQPKFDLPVENRTKSRLSSRPNSTIKRKGSATPRPTSAALFQHPLPSLLSTTPGDELKALADQQSHSRPSSAALKKSSRIESRIPSMWNRNWKPEQSVSDGIDLKSVRIDQQALMQFDAALEDLLDETKIEIANGIEPTPSVTPRNLSARNEKEIVGRRSLFTFHESARRSDSSASADFGDGGFFTDVRPPKNPEPSIMTQEKASREWQPILSQRSTNEKRSVRSPLVSMRLNSIENFSPTPPKLSTNLEEIRLAPSEDQSRPPSSLSSASLPVSITSSQPDNITRPSIERHPKLTPSSTKKFRVEFQKKSPVPPVPAPAPAPPMLIEGKKVTSARDREESTSIHSSRAKFSAGLNKSASHSNGNLMKTSSTSSMTSITREENLLRDESLTITDGSTQKNPLRRSTKSRKIEFTVKDGLKWQKASNDLGTSKRITSRPSTPSNPVNTKVANQFSSYDVDDGRSSRAYQDIEDEACYDQLRQELTSQLSMTSPDWNASLSEHVLKNLRTNDVQFNEKEIQENLNMLEIKIRENETLRRSQTDDDLSVHEEIRNL